MGYCKWIVHSVLLFTIPFSSLYPQADFSALSLQDHEGTYEPLRLDYSMSYDDILKLFDDLESGELEKRCSEADVERLIHFMINLARQGILPNEIEEGFILEEDIQELLREENDPDEYGFSFGHGNDYVIVPAFFYDQEGVILCKNKTWVSKKINQVTKFGKKHKKALIIATVVAVAVITVVGIAAASTAGVAAAGAACSGSDKENKSKTTDKPASVSPAMPSTDSSSAMVDIRSEAPMLESVIEEQIFSFKENLVKEHFLEPPPHGGYSLEENGRVLGSVFAHDSFRNLNTQLSEYPQLAGELRNIDLQRHFPMSKGPSETQLDFAHREIDQKFSTDYASLYANPREELDFNTLSYQLQGERALASGHLNEAIYDLGRAIELDPTRPLPYLERGVAHFGLGEYDYSIQDYHQYTAQTQKTHPLSIPDFSVGFAKGLPQGIYDSGEGIFLFLSDLVQHPVHTGEQTWRALTLLTELARSEQWDLLREVLAPEVHQLIKDWDAIPSDKRGELAGYAFGKHGSDIIIPGALAKVVAKGVKGAQELSAVYKSLQTAEKTLLLESTSGLESGAQIAEVIRANQTTLALGEEVGFTAHEMGQLKKAGTLDGAVNNALEDLVVTSESKVLRAAIDEGKHVKFTQDYLSKPTKEIQKGIASYEKQIAIHQEKISNPVKYYQDWDKLDPRQKNALINKKWPEEISLYTKQKETLQAILNERN